MRSVSIGNAASAYERFLLENATRISSIESTLRSLSWFLPGTTVLLPSPRSFLTLYDDAGRFQDSELASEARSSYFPPFPALAQSCRSAVYSILNIVSLYHDSLLHRSLPSLPASARPNPSSHARYTRFCSSTSTTYAALARTLTILSYSELFIEMAIKKRLGKEKAEKAVMIIEMAKALMRLALLNETDGRLGVSPPIPEREVDPALFDQHKRVVVLEENSARIEYPRSSADVLLGARGEEEVVGVAEKEYWLGSRTGYSRPTLASIRPPVDPLLGNATSSLGGKEIIQQYLMSRVLTAEDAKRPEDLVAKMNRLGKLAEIVWILRPVIYGLSFRSHRKQCEPDAPDSGGNEEIRSSACVPLPPLPLSRIFRLLPSSVQHDQLALFR